MKFSFNKQIDYIAPEGEHFARLSNIYYDPDKKWLHDCAAEVRLSFYLETGDRLIQYVAARNFCLDCGQTTDLQAFLSAWLGPDLEAFVDDDGEIELERLRDRPALITIEHRHKKGGKHSKPLCLIASIAPAPDQLEQLAA